MVRFKFEFEKKIEFVREIGGIVRFKFEFGKKTFEFVREIGEIGRR